MLTILKHGGSAFRWLLGVEHLELLPPGAAHVLGYRSFEGEADDLATAMRDAEAARDGLMATREHKERSRPHGQRVLTWEMVNALRAEVAERRATTGNRKLVDLARKYDIAACTASDIVCGRTWREA